MKTMLEYKVRKSSKERKSSKVNFDLDIAGEFVVIKGSKLR